MKYVIIGAGVADVYKRQKEALSGVRLAAVADCYYFLYAGSTDRPGVNIGNNLFFRSW